ncbi:hypothetical protein LINGRAHAP2_LOCUS31301 [Linum grandiflorum]
MTARVIMILRRNVFIRIFLLLTSGN